MFAYAFNNPISYSDHTGNWPKLSKIFTIVAVAAVTVAVVAAAVATAGTAVPALAAIGGGIFGGISAGTVAAAATVVASVSTAAAAASSVYEKTSERKLRTNNTVYKLVDRNGTAQYVGRTTNLKAREAAHKNNPYRKDLKLEVIASGLNYQARGLEQIAMLEYHTINTANRMNNQINGISPFNRRLSLYMAAGRGALGYGENQISNEILYWTGR